MRAKIPIDLGVTGAVMPSVRVSGYGGGPNGRPIGSVREALVDFWGNRFISRLVKTATAARFFENRGYIHVPESGGAGIREMYRIKRAQRILRQGTRYDDDKGISLASGTIRIDGSYYRVRLSTATLQEVQACLNYENARLQGVHSGASQLHVAALEFFSRSKLEGGLDHRYDFYVRPDGKPRKF